MLGRGGMGLKYVGSGTKYTKIPGSCRVSYARDTQVPTNYCVLLYKWRLYFKPKNHYRSIKLGHLAVLARS